MMAGESRNELISWCNNMLSLNYTRIEQFGSGAAHCQIVDSIFNDVPLQRVKFQAKHEYEYVANFKVLQAAFDKHGIENAIPVERLIKCKFQDNLEFLQMVKRYWDGHYNGADYDAGARRGGAPTAATTPRAKVTSPVKATSAKVAPRKVTAPTNRADPIEKHQDYARMMEDFSVQSSELKASLEQVEKEREFYFGKLREIEIHVNGLMEDPSMSPACMDVLNQVQGIMYKTEDGFEVPATA